MVSGTDSGASGGPEARQMKRPFVIGPSSELAARRGAGHGPENPPHGPQHVNVRRVPNPYADFCRRKVVGTYLSESQPANECPRPELSILL